MKFIDFLLKISITTLGCLIAFLLVVVSFKNSKEDSLVQEVVEEKIIERIIESCEYKKE